MPGSIKLNAGQFFGISYHSRFWHSGFIRIPVELGLVQNPESQNPENLMSGTLSLMQANFSGFRTILDFGIRDFVRIPIQ